MFIKKSEFINKEINLFMHIHYYYYYHYDFHYCCFYYYDVPSGKTYTDTHTHILNTSHRFHREWNMNSENYLNFFTFFTANVYHVEDSHLTCFQCDENYYGKNFSSWVFVWMMDVLCTKGSVFISGQFVCDLIKEMECNNKSWNAS